MNGKNIIRLNVLVDSSIIHRIEYDSRKMQLKVRFVRKGFFRKSVVFNEITFQRAVEIISAESVGREILKMRKELLESYLY